MGLQVLLQVALQPTGLPAVGACVRREAGVHGAVLEEVRLEAERLPADIAAEGLLVRVDDRVLLEA